MGCITEVHLRRAIEIVKNGGIIAYPTEAIYGLGCDPSNEKAVQRLLAIKQRSIDKGLILISNDWETLKPWTDSISPEQLKQIQETWPGPVTWLVPKSQLAPVCISGEHETIAIRVTDHPIATKLCKLWGKPIVSTSANIKDEAPGETYEQVKKLFGDQIDYYIPGEVGPETKPSKIIDALTGKIIRE